MNSANETVVIPQSEVTANVGSDVKQAAKSSKANGKKSKIVSVGLNHGEGVAIPEGLQMFSFDLANFTKSVSELCKLVSWSITFRLFDTVITLPALKKSNDNSFRSFAIFKQVAAAIFGKSDLETIHKFDANSREQLILSNFHAKGFKFSTCSKKAVMTQIETKEKVKKELLKNIVSHEMENMQKDVALIAELKEDTKLTNERNGKAISKFRLVFAADIKKRNGLQIAEYSVKQD